MPPQFRFQIAAIASAGLALALVIQSAGLAREPDVPKVGWITRERLLNADQEPQNWLTLGRDFAGSYYSPLRQITPATCTPGLRLAVRAPTRGAWRPGRSSSTA